MSSSGETFETADFERNSERGAMFAQHMLCEAGCSPSDRGKPRKLGLDWMTPWRNHNGHIPHGTQVDLKALGNVSFRVAKQHCLSRSSVRSGSQARCASFKDKNVLPKLAKSRHLQRFFFNPAAGISLAILQLICLPPPFSVDHGRLSSVRFALAAKSTAFRYAPCHLHVTLPIRPCVG